MLQCVEAEFEGRDSLLLFPRAGLLILDVWKGGCFGSWFGFLVALYLLR